MRDEASIGSRAGLNAYPGGEKRQPPPLRLVRTKEEAELFVDVGMREGDQSVGKEPPLILGLTVG